MRSIRKHKYWEQTICLLLAVLMLLVIAACTRSTCDCPCYCNDPAGNGSAVRTPAPPGQTASGHGPGITLSGNPLAVHIMVNSLQTNMQFADGTRVSVTLCPEEMTQVARRMGFYLEFHLFESWTGFGGQMSGEQFTALLHEHYDAVFVVPYHWAAAHLPGDLVQDITEAVQTHLPELYSDIVFYGNDVDGSVFLLPTSMGAANIGRPIMRVNRDMFEQYGMPVATVDDLEKLLRWQRDRQGGAPAVTWTTFGSFSNFVNASVALHHSNTHILPLDLFMPRMGYTSLRAMFAHDAHIVNDLWIDREGRIAAWWEIDAAGDAFDDFMAWHFEGLVDFVRPGGFSIRPGTGTAERPEEPIADYTVILGSVNYNAVDVTAFTAAVLSEPALWFPNVNTVAFSTHGADMTEFLRFMQHLLSDIDAYVEFVYGEEGRDYEWVIDQGTMRLDLGNFNTARRVELSSTRGFVNTARFAPYLFGQNMPDQAASPPDYPLTRAQRREIGTALAECRDYQAFRAEMEKYLTDYFDAMYENPNSVYSFWQAMHTIRRMEGSDIATRMVNDALRR